MTSQGSLDESSITLTMECSVDELSPMQLISFEEKTNRFSEMSRVFNTLTENGELIYENTFVSLIFISNYSSSSEYVHILPDNESVSNFRVIGTDLELYDNMSQLRNCYYTKFTNPQSVNKIVRNFPLETFSQYHLRGSVHNLDHPDPNVGTQLLNSTNNGIEHNVKLHRRIHPSLLVKAVPGELFGHISNEIKNEEVLYFDKNIKKILSYDAERFTEWLLKRGLLHPLQFCKIHGISEKSRLKINQRRVFRNKSRFFNSGGYVLKSDCCLNTYFSVFKGTLFEGVRCPVNVLILLYHWSCQTSVSTVMESLQINENYLKTFYSNLRGICIAAIHEDCKNLLGGKNKMVEVGFMSLELETSNYGHVNIWFVGVLDSETKLIKLNVLRKSTKCTKPKPCENRTLLNFLTKLVDKKSTILTDLQLHRNFFTAIGFKNVYQRPIKNQVKKKIYSNENIMSYLKINLPQMFGNNLAYLNRPLIQQHLDELCWREKWGVTSLKAFNSMIDHVRKQIILCVNSPLTSILSKISRYPFINWQYSRWKINIQKLQKCNKQTVGNTKNNLSFNRIIGNTVSQNLGVGNKLLSSVDVTLQNSIDRTYLSFDKEFPISINPINDESNSNEATNNVNKTANKSVQAINFSNYTTVESDEKTETTTNKTLQKLTAVNYKPMPAELVPLECYYYGILPGNVLNSERKEPLDVKCILCGLSLKTNICLMKHIMKHAFSSLDDRSVNDTLWCKYCLKPCVTYQRLCQNPINENDLNCVNNHFKSTTPSATCLICEKDFKFRAKLILHMHFFHNEIELPYVCGVCNFRSSQHHMTVDHFYKMHSNSDTGQCPLCLKIVTFKDDDGVIVMQNVYDFLNHMRKHNRNDLVFKCDRCVLSFVDDGVFKYHKAIHHNSCKHVLNVIRWNSSVIMMPNPPHWNYETNINQSAINLSRTCIYSQLNITICLAESYKNAVCFECDKYMMAENHLFGEFSCLICSFKTCCEKSMFEHANNLHYRSCKTGTTISKKILLKSPMCCLCGFKSVFGNRLAEHLVNCGKISAYKSE